MATIRVTVTADIEIPDEDWAEYGTNNDMIFALFRDRLFDETTEWKLEKEEVSG